MKLVSWNILANEFISPEDYPMLSVETLFNRKNRFRQIVRVLKTLDADIIFLQEVMLWEYRRLAKALQVYHVYRGKNIKWYAESSHSGNLILLRKNLFHRRAPIYDFPFGFGLRLPDGLLVNVHLNDKSHTKRLKEIKHLLPFFAREKSVILGGDFNQNYKSTSSLYKCLAVAGFKTYMKEPTYFLDKKMSIDHLLVKGSNWPQGAIEPVQIFDGNFAKQFKVYGSDHLPVVLRI